jgi:hypothetical protein
MEKVGPVKDRINLCAGTIFTFMKAASIFRIWIWKNIIGGQENER